MHGSCRYAAASSLPPPAPPLPLVAHPLLPPRCLPASAPLPPVRARGGPSVRNIQTYNAPGPRRYIGINLWGLGGPPRQAIYAPIGLNISRFCAPSTSPRFRPSVFSTHPLLAADLPPRRRPSTLSSVLRVAPSVRPRVAPFRDCEFTFFVSSSVPTRRRASHRGDAKTVILRDWHVFHELHEPLRDVGSRKSSQEREGDYRFREN